MHSALHRRGSLLILFLLCVVFLAGCGAADQQASRQTQSTAVTGYHKISAQQAKQIMDGNQPFTLVDVRTGAEYREAHIKGAILIPDYEITEQAKTKLPDKNKIVLTYCRSGARSANAAHALADMGYTRVYDFGGIVDWPYGTVSN